MSLGLQCLIHWDESHVLTNSVSQESFSTVRKRINNERARTGHLYQQCGTSLTAVRMQHLCRGTEGAGILCVLFPTGLSVGETPGSFLLKATNFTEYTPTGLVFQHPCQEFYQWNAKATPESASRTT